MSDDTVKRGEIASGDAGYFALLYEEIRRLASGHIRREAAGHSLHTTALLHEAYLKMQRLNHSSFNNRSHFLAHASIAMRQILIDHARKNRRRIKLIAESAGPEVPLGADDPLFSEHDFLDVIEAIDALATEYPRAEQVIRYRYLLGCDVKEVAAELGVAEGTVKGDTRLALAWLRRRLLEA